MSWSDSDPPLRYYGTCRIRVGRAELASLHTDRTMSNDAQKPKSDASKYVGHGAGLGLLFGTALGVVWGNLAVGAAVGLVVGPAIAIVAGLSQAKKKNAG